MAQESNSMLGSIYEYCLLDRIIYQGFEIKKVIDQIYLLSLG
jgi:hypothetical protein